MGLLETIKQIIQDTIDQQPRILYGTVTYYYEGTATVNTDNGVFENIRCANTPKIGCACILLPVKDEYFCIPQETDDTNQIYAEGLGKFNINDDGDLIIDLPIGVTNYFSINNNGDLIINLDDETNQKFSINDDGDVIYGDL